MSDDMKNVNPNDRPPLRVQNVPGNVSRRHAERITEDAVKSSSASSSGPEGEEQYSLNDDRRVKVLSPGAMVAKRFSATGSPWSVSPSSPSCSCSLLSAG